MNRWTILLLVLLAAGFAVFWFRETAKRGDNVIPMPAPEETETRQEDDFLPIPFGHPAASFGGEVPNAPVSVAGFKAPLADEPTLSAAGPVPRHTLVIEGRE